MYFPSSTIVVPKLRVHAVGSRIVSRNQIGLNCYKMYHSYYKIYNRSQSSNTGNIVCIMSNVFRLTQVIAWVTSLCIQYLWVRIQKVWAPLTVCTKTKAHIVLPCVPDSDISSGTNCTALTKVFRRLTKQDPSPKLWAKGINLGKWAQAKLRLSGCCPNRKCYAGDQCKRWGEDWVYRKGGGKGMERGNNYDLI